MNYLLKRQASPGGVMESVLNNVKHDNTQKLHLSYVSALKERLQKRAQKRTRKNESSSQVIEQAKLKDMLKIRFPPCSSRRVVMQKKYVSQVGYKIKLNNRYNVDCTKSYDPILLNYNLEVEKLCNTLPIKSKLLGDPKVKGVKVLRNQVYAELDKKVNSRTYNSLQNKQNSIESKLSIVSKPQKNEDCVVARHKIKDKIIEKVLLEKAQKKPQKWEQTFTVPRDFKQNFTEVLTSDSSCAMFLHSSIDICTTNNMIMEAFGMFQAHRMRKFWKRLIIRNPKITGEICNTLLHALSTKGHWYLMTRVTKWMEVDRIKLNQESFAALLNCLANIKDTGGEVFASEEIPKLLNMIFKSNVSLNTIFLETQIKDKYEKILPLVREVIPSFEVRPETMELSSDCSLLKNLHKTPNKLQPQVDGLEADVVKHLVEEQLLKEKNFYVDVQAISRGRPGEVPSSEAKKLSNIKRQWRIDLTRAVNSLHRRLRLRELRNPYLFNLYLYLTCLPVTKLVDILMETAQNLIEFSGGFSPSCHQFHKMLGLKVYHCYQLRKKDLTGITERTEKLFKEYVSWYANPSGPAMNSRQQWQMLIQDSEKFDHVLQEIKWPDVVHIRLGKLLLKTILEETRFTVTTKTGVMTLPAMYTILRWRTDIFREEVKCHPVLAKLIRSIGFDVLHFRCDEVPMICPPKPWKDSHHGGYLFLSTDLIRKPTGFEGKMIRLKDIPVQKLYAVLDSLNALQAVPWMINEDVLDVALEVFRQGGSEKLRVPLLPQKPPPREKLSEEMSYVERRRHYKLREELVSSLANNYSLWCEALYRLSLANHFRKRMLWMPQNCDFRGRVYPVPPLINHLGSDLFRALLVFAKGKPLGPKGLDWLKIHLINLTGTHKKRSTRERLEYANEILPHIFDSAEKPLTGKKWWMESDDPWQTLSACIEMRKALSSPNPETYICRFPIHQDGSCNGLQHYAALGKDLVGFIGAQSVNLVPCEKPQDVYSVVAELIEQERVKDALSGIEIAKVLSGFVERKVVKQTVMTTVYGVTLFGAKLQIMKRLEEIPNFPQEHVKMAAGYLAQKTFFCLRKMFNSAKQIQDWFINCAEEICNRKEFVQWNSPMDLPVLQSYAKRRICAKTSERKIVTDTRKQKNAFPPNFIHSLDSCHMMLTSLYCEQAGLTFAAVHDCFWTHPNTVDIMNRICREQFISLHSQPILEDLSKGFKETYSHIGMTDEITKVFESVPEKGSFDIKEVLNSEYFFS